MASKRILELWTLASATKSIAKHHLRLRSKQLNVYGLGGKSTPTVERVSELLKENNDLKEEKVLPTEPFRTEPIVEKHTKRREPDRTSWGREERKERERRALRAAAEGFNDPTGVLVKGPEQKVVLSEPPPIAYLTGKWLPKTSSKSDKIWDTVHKNSKRRRPIQWADYYGSEVESTPVQPEDTILSGKDGVLRDTQVGAVSDTVKFTPSTVQTSSSTILQEPEDTIEIPQQPVAPIDSAAIFDTVTNARAAQQAATTTIPQRPEDSIEEPSIKAESPVGTEAVYDTVKVVDSQKLAGAKPQKPEDQLSQSDIESEANPTGAEFDTAKVTQPREASTVPPQKPEDQLAEPEIQSSETQPEAQFNTIKLTQAQEPPKATPQKPEDILSNSDIEHSKKISAAELTRLETALGSIGAREQDMEDIEEQELHTHLPHKRRQLQESAVPTSRLSRIFHYGGLATSLAFGASTEWVRRVGSGDKSGSVLLSEKNIERLVNKLTKMRGAALKLGQMLSIQDSKLLPPAMQEVLTRVQDSANYMPARQRDQVLTQNLGPNWRKLFSEFEEIPMAAASIGQVHAAKLASTGMDVVVKVQYPGVAESIDSDLSNIAMLLMASKMLPKGLYLDKTIENARTELAWECDYIREANCARRFHELLKDESDIYCVPRIISEASGKTVLTMERMWGTAVTRMIDRLTQEQRDYIGSNILRLCLLEVCDYAFMQTDPNWTNFLWNEKTQKIELLDFGASREFPPQFIRLYVGVLCAAARGDRKACKQLSIDLGYLTGYESEAMTEAHINSIVTLAEPYRHDAPEVYDFSNQTITDRVKELIPLMLKERLSPPPEETYSLHRKMSGAFLLCARLGSRIRCREIFEDAVSRAQSL